MRRSPGSKRAIARAAGVDHDRAAARRAQEQPVALADVDDTQVKPSVGHAGHDGPSASASVHSREQQQAVRPFAAQQKRQADATQSASAASEGAGHAQVEPAGRGPEVAGERAAARAASQASVAREAAQAEGRRRQHGEAREQHRTRERYCRDVEQDGGRSEPMEVPGEQRSQRALGGDEAASASSRRSGRRGTRA